MNPTDFENHLRSLPFRKPPESLRAGILTAARRTIPWRELVWPPPAAWVGLAALWLLLAAVGWLAGPTPPAPTPVPLSVRPAGTHATTARLSLLSLQLEP